MNEEILKILRRVDVREKLSAEGGDIIGSTPEQFKEHLATQIERMARVVKEAKMQPD